MTGSIPLHLAGGVAGPGSLPAPVSALRASAPLALYLGGAALFQNALRASIADGLVLRVEAALLAGVLALLAIALLERRAGGDALATVGLRGSSAGALLRGLALYAVAFPILALASQIAPEGASRDSLLQLVPAFDSIPLRLAGWAAGILAVVVAIPLLEEILFRGWLQGAASARVGPWLAVPAVAALWALGHAPAERPAILLLGLLLGFLYRRTGRLAACVGVHALHNALALFLFPAPGWLEWTGA